MRLFLMVALHVVAVVATLAATFGLLAALHALFAPVISDIVAVALGVAGISALVLTHKHL